MFKRSKRLRLLTAIALMFQFVVVLITYLTASEKKDKGLGATVFLSSIGGLCGAYLVYKDIIEPKLSEKMSDYTLDYDNDDFDIYADLVGELPIEDTLAD